MRNIIACASLLMCLTGSASAMDFRDDLNSSHQSIQKVGWDQKNVDAQAGGFRYLRSQIKRLERENEQLRNGISSIRSGKVSYGKQKPDPRILALIEENKRLSKLLSKGGGLPKYTSTPSEEIYAQQIHVLKAENQVLNAKVGKLSSAKRKLEAQKNDGGGVISDSSTLKGYVEENAKLKEMLNLSKRDARKVASLRDQIDKLKEENEGLSYSKAGSKKAVYLQAQIKELTLENDEYRKASNKVSSISSDIDHNVEILKKDAELDEVKTALAEAQDDSQNLRVSLTEANQEALSYNKHADKAIDAYKNNMRALEILKQQLSKAQKEKRDLKAELKLSSETFSVPSNDTADAIKQQNESLRDTIRAQSESLLSADNAAKTAERLLTENSNLQRKLSLVEKSGSLNGRKAHELSGRVKELQLDVAKRDHYIKKMLESKNELVSADTRSSAPSSMSPAQRASLREKNKALVEALDKERENNIAYRKKIVEYQKKVSSLKDDEKASNSGIHKVSIYERHVKALEQKQQKADNDLTSLRLENQDLKARIKLLSKEDKKSASLLDEEIPEGDNKFEKEVTFIDTTYPSVERVLPIFDSQGNKIDYDDDGKKNRTKQSRASVEDMLEDRLAVNESAIKPEALLAKELHPLSSR